MNERIVEYINILGGFCGKRDVSQLSPEELKKTYGIDQADVMVLFGGSILCGGDVLAQAMQSHAAKKYVIAGGAGHTTEALRIRVHQEFPDIETAGLPEARVFASYLKARYGWRPIFWNAAPPTAATILRIFWICCGKIRFPSVPSSWHRMPPCSTAWKPDCASTSRMTSPS